MTHTHHTRRSSKSFAAAAFAFLFVAPLAARAAECPASSPEDPQERRRLAKEWFGNAETAENAGNDAEAVRAYACSYKMVAHPFTAYNLGRVAERAGDNELALKMFKAYLTLKPDAQDKDEVKGKIKAIEDKMASAKEASSTEGGTAPEETAEKPAEPAAPPPTPAEELAPPPEPKPAPPPPVRVAKPAEQEEEAPSHAAEWIVGGASVAALVTGVGLNLAARSKMSACQADATKGSLKTANTECEDAKPLAYWSYGMFAVAASGAAVDAVLLILRHASGSSGGDDDSSVSFLVLPGGGALTAHTRF